MTILYYDCFSGISGDMNLAALIDVGVDKDYLLAELKKLNISGYDIEIGINNKMGIFGTQVKVKLSSEHNHTHSHDEHTHGGHTHSHGLGNVHLPHSHSIPSSLKMGVDIKHHEPHRNLADIKHIIESSPLSDNVKMLSMKIFNLIGVAEAKIHNKTIDEIHFHEVGAVDSIVDIVGAAICFDYLKVDKIISSSVQLGGGMVKCAHGTFPVPAPATAEILKGKPVRLGAVQSETTTPTGAAILAAMVDEFDDTCTLNISKIGYGIGHKDFAIPNVLRVYLCKSDESKYNTDNSVIAECNFDDMNPEIFDSIFEKLFSIGAEDVFIEPITMKKSRPGTKLSVLFKPEIQNQVADILLKETTTLGFRFYPVTRQILDRKIETITTKYGDIRVKFAGINNEIYKAKPEYEDCLKLAKANIVSVMEIMNEANIIVSEKLKVKSDALSVSKGEK